MTTHKKKVGLVSLGCDKNRVDGEKLLYEVAKHYDITSSIEEANVLIVNTCAFLGSAREEAINTVFEYLPYKQDGNLEKIIMTGCLPQKFVGDMFDDFTEVDAFLGTKDGSLITQAIDEVYKGKRLNLVGKGKELGCSRIVTTPGHFAYLKISDGCNNHCTYCLIPKIRGKFVSRPIESLIEEAKDLGKVEELILVAQDTTRYGEDLYGEIRLVELIRALSALETVKHIRLMYCYPELIDDKLIAEIRDNEKVIKYLDIPLQHASDRILKLMNRKGSYASYVALVNKLKEEIPSLVIRSTFIAGFPTETEDDVITLENFLKEAKLMNAGFFAYSREKDTPAYKIEGQMKESVKKQRVKRLYAVQQAIVEEITSSLVGKTFDVVCDGLDYDKQLFYGRAYFNAPDIDGKVYLRSDGVINEGETYKVKIISATSYDLYGEIENET